jgi:hypothetical protein
MKYMLMVNIPGGSDHACLASSSWPAEDMERHMAHIYGLYRDLAAAGELVDCRTLAPQSTARLVRARKGGPPAVTDGPFPEAKEFLAGFWIVDVASPERAYEIAARFGSAPGAGGVPQGLPVEVRQVMSPPDAEA